MVDSTRKQGSGASQGELSPEAILGAHPDATLVVDDDVVVYVNPAGLRMFRAETDRVVGRPIGDLVAPGELERLHNIEAQRDAGWSLPSTCQLRFACGERRVTADVRWESIMLGGRRALLVSARDVTDQSRAEKLIGELGTLMSDPAALRGADAFLDRGASIFAALGWSIAFTEIYDGHSVTKRVLAEPGDPVGDYAKSLLDKPLPFSMTPVLAEVVRTGRALFLDNVPALLAGAPKTAAALSEAMTRAKITRTVWCPVRVGGRATHLLTVASADLTEHDFAAIQLLAAHVGASIRLSELRTELVVRERLAAVGETAAVLAHEVRSPLAVIVNTLGLMKKEKGPSELVDILGEEVERLNRLVRDVLVFVGPVTERTLETVSLPSLCDQALEATKQDPVYQKAAPRLEVDVPDDLPPVSGEPRLLLRAIMNLLVNAFEAIARGGVVRVVGARGAGNTVSLAISNDGPPIDPAVVSRVFDPFFTTKPTGTGLGLAVVKRIVDDSGGRVSLETGGAGVTFRIELPIA